MAAENDEKEGLDDGGVADIKKSLYKWLPFALLLLFLVGGGFYALSAMRQAAHKLGGGENYNQLSANTAVYNGKVSPARSEDSFAYDEPLAEETAALAAADKDAQFAAAKALQTRPSASGGGLTPPSMPPEEQQAYAADASASGASPATMAARLQSRISGISRASGGASKTTGQGGAEGFQGGGPAAGKVSAQRTTADGAPKKGGKTSVLDSLKGSFRASLYGARLSSQDSAKGWISRTFDATPEYDTAIQYDDKMRSKLDKVNPNSIPKFLREQDISAAEAKTLAASDVAKPEVGVDKDASEEAHEKDASEKKKKTATDMTSGVVNSMFSGLGSSLGEEGGTDPEGRMDLMSSDPNADPNLLGIDEFGNTMLAGPGGLSYIYSPEGDLLGCEDSAAGMCLMAGFGDCN